MSHWLTISGEGSSITQDYLYPIELDKNRQYEIGLRALYTYNNMPNVTEKNNSLHYTENGSEEIFTLPVGIYEFTNIASNIEEHFTRSFTVESVRKARRRHNGGVDIDSKEELTERNPGETDEKIKNTIRKKTVFLSVNRNTLQSKLLIQRDSGINIDFSKPNSIGSLLGFTTTALLYPNIPYLSDKPISIFDVNVIQVECNLVSGSYVNNRRTHTLYEFYPTVQAGYKIMEVPSSIIYLPVSERYITHLSITLRSNRGDIIDLRGEELSVSLHLRSVSNN